VTQLVLDASVIVKWLIRDPDREPDSERAGEIFRAVQRHSIQLVQPPHWLSEVAAVLARLSPATAEEDVADLHDLDLEVARTEGIYTTAVRLAIEMDHHLFDTLYHAVALELPDATLVTSDERYYRKARRLGRIHPLSGWNGEGGDDRDCPSGR
jgi:predicted nucleic acid-binding protein